MPELPEVETVVRGLKPIEGSSISKTIVQDEMLIGNYESSQDFSKCLKKQRVKDIVRVGKYCCILLESAILLFSLRMTGNLKVARSDEISRTSYVRFELDDLHLWFTSVRRFSNVHICSTVQLDEVDKIQKLGRDPFRDGLDVNDLKRAFNGRTAPVKTLLMNQQCLAGIGNIYANEICFHARVDPQRSVNELGDAELDRISKSVTEVLEKAIELGGSSIRDYKNAEGDSGQFQDRFNVYGRDEEDCPKCATSISRIELAGRSTFWCNTCQS